MSISTLHLVTSFTCRKVTTWDRRLYCSSEGRGAEDFFDIKIRRLRPGVNPLTWVPKASTLPLDHRSRANRARHIYHTDSLHLPGHPLIETVTQETHSAKIQKFRCYLQEKWLPKRDLYCQKKLFLGKGCMVRLCTRCSTGASWHTTYLSLRSWHQGWHCRYTQCPFLCSAADWSTGACRCLQAWSRCSLCLAPGRRSRMPVACRQSAKYIDDFFVFEML
jgi:hypothetical protein